jgi:endonuclease YncB( thermonuclease family)
MRRLYTKKPYILSSPQPRRREMRLPLSWQYPLKIGLAISSAGLYIASMRMDKYKWTLHVLIAIGAALFCLAEAFAADWQTWKDCTLLGDEYMDGDSFHVKRGPRSEYIIRLYFVDCPESDNRFPDRVGEQAEYFGISSKDALKSGETATDFTRKILKRGFTVHTRKDKSFSASSKPRYYGFIELPDGRFLSEELVRQGLARIYGKPSERPDGKGRATIYRRLEKLEQEAKERKLGAWKYNDDISRSAKVKISEPGFEPGRQITTTRTISIYTLDKPHRFRGLLRDGAVLTLHELRDNQYVLVSFDNGGKEERGLCLRRELDM